MCLQAHKFSFIIYPSCYFMRQNFSLSLMLTDLGRVIGQPNPTDPLLLNIGIIGWCLWVLRLELRSLSLCTNNYHLHMSYTQIE